MAQSKHPLIAAHGTHAFPNLISQGLKPKPVVGLRQGAGNGFIGTWLLLGVEEDGNGFLKAPLQQMLVASKGTSPRRVTPDFSGK